MKKTNNQIKELQFSHLTSTGSIDTGSTGNWITEVLSTASNELRDADPLSDLADGEIETSSNSTSTPMSRGELHYAPKKKRQSAVSFVNVSGAPTKDGRNRARKQATMARKKEKQEKLRQAERDSLLAALTVPSGDTPYSYKTTSNVPIQFIKLSPTFKEKVDSISRFGSSRSDPFVKYPSELSHRDRQLLDHIFHSEAQSIKPYKEAFFPVGLTDAAAFHQVIANLAVQLHAHRRPSQCDCADAYEKYEVVAHHACALAMIQKRLSDPQQAMSEGTIATVIAMICYAHLTKDFVAWHSHIKGLRQLLDLQGGLRDPTLNKWGSLRVGFFGLDTLLGPALSWIDANGSASQDIRPRFPLSPYACLSAFPVLEIPPSRAALTLAASLTQAFPSGKPIFELFNDTAYLAARFKADVTYTSARKIYEDPMWSWTHLYPLAHNILSYRVPVDVDDYESVIKESCRLALSIFVTNVRRQFGIAPLVLDIYVDQLLPLLSNPVIPGNWGLFNDFRLWVLVVGCMEARKETRDGLLALLKGTIHVMGINNHKTLGDRVGRLIWIDEIDSVRFWELEKDLLGISDAD